MKKFKFNKLISILLIFVLLQITFGMIPSVSTNSSSILDAVQFQEYSDEYKEWLNLSDEKKANTIQPPQYINEYTPAQTQTNTRSLSLRTSVSLISNYNLADYIDITIKDQQSTNACWAFSTLSSLETNLALISNEYYDFSERHMEYATSKTFQDGINSLGYNREVGVGGNSSLGFNYIVSGNGPVSESEMPFENNENQLTLSEIENKTVETKVNSFVYFPNVTAETKANTDMTEFRNMIKEHIMKYGSVTAAIYSPAVVSDLQYYNASTGAYYYTGSNSINHQISVVGWDDNYSIDNFNSTNKPTNPGAYIIRNSYGTEWGDEGYGYISYEDPYIEYFMTGIIDAGAIDYDNLYQYNTLGSNTSIGLSSNSAYAANIFTRTSNKSEFLTQIGLELNQNTDYEIYINTNGTLDLNSSTLVSKSTNELSSGYYTINLDNPVYLTNENFAVIVKYTTSDSLYPIPVAANYSYWDVDTYEAGNSYILYNDTWYDMATQISGSNKYQATIKAFTVEETDISVENIELNEENITIKKGTTQTLVATLTPSSLASSYINWTSSDLNIATVDQSGNVTAVSKGTTNITVTSIDGQKSATCKVTVIDPSLVIGSVSPNTRILYTDQSEPLIIPITFVDADLSVIYVYIKKGETIVTDNFDLSLNENGTSGLILTITPKTTLEAGSYTVEIHSNNLETVTIDFLISDPDTTGNSTTDDNTSNNNSTDDNNTNDDSNSTNNNSNSSTNSNTNNTSNSVDNSSSNTISSSSSDSTTSNTITSSTSTTNQESESSSEFPETGSSPTIIFSIYSLLILAGISGFKYLSLKNI